MNYTHEEILKFLLIIDNYKNNEEGFFFQTKWDVNHPKRVIFSLKWDNFGVRIVVKVKAIFLVMMIKLTLRDIILDRNLFIGENTTLKTRLKN